LYEIKDDAENCSQTDSAESHPVKVKTHPVDVASDCGVVHHKKEENREDV